MIVTVSGLVMIFLFAFLGYIKGVWRILTDFTALLLAALLSGAVSPVFLPVVNNFDFIPRTLKPLTSVILTMLILFLFLLISLQVWKFGVRHYRSTGS